jgi:hypothetical protein
MNVWETEKKNVRNFTEGMVKGECKAVPQHTYGGAGGEEV